jgi:hypothetical protein
MKSKNKKFDECEGVNFDFNKVFIGAVFILIGLAYLFKILGLVNFNINIFIFWPLLIIFLGLSVLSKRNITSNVIGIVTALIVFFAFYFSINYPQDYSQIENIPININMEQGIKRAEINLEAGMGEISVSGGEEDKIVSGRLLSNVMKMETSSYVNNEVQFVSIVPKDSDDGFSKSKLKNDLLLSIKNNIPVGFNFLGGAANTNLDLRNVLADKINIKTGASNLDLKIGNKISSNININAGMSSVNITLPKDVGVMITIDGGLSSKTLKGLIMENDRVYKTPDYDLKEKRIIIDISIGLANLNIDWEDMETPKTKIQLFYYNKLEDKDIECGIKYVLPIEREIDLTQTPLQDAINLLIKGEITQEEKEKGFITEFPNEDFKLISANLKEGVLYLEFTEVPGFTSGGSCRVSILANQIIKTAKQFLGVNEVILLPESIFQP